MKSIFHLAIFSAVFIGSCLGHSLNSRSEYDTDGMHRSPQHSQDFFNRLDDVEDAEFWQKSAQDMLEEKLSRKRNEKQAKNVIFFLGDGMSLPTVTAARIFKGQKEGLTFGEEAQLHFETFPNVGVSKTYCIDSTVADSACSATAYLTGVKTNYGTTGTAPAVKRGDCIAQMKSDNQPSSILAWAQAAGKSTGVVTTTRITDASPSGNYGHIAERGWNDDQDVLSANLKPDECDDIAKQLILRSPGSDINVILGGGRQHFMLATEEDPENTGSKGRRQDVNLVNEWAKDKDTKKKGHEYVWNRDDLLKVDTKNTDYLLGFFSRDDLEYNDTALAKGDPSLFEMTKVAIEILSKNPNGFYLFVEGGLIDHGHHSGTAQRALVETLEFEKAIQYADSVTDDEDTLITVTSDHAHVMTISGYPVRGNPILEIAGKSDVDQLPYSTLSYQNGPGYKKPNPDGGRRYNITEDNFNDIGYKHMANLPLGSETHGGDDVLIFTKGPFSHLLSGVVEQNYIPHALAYAACIGERNTFCKKA